MVSIGKVLLKCLFVMDEAVRQLRLAESRQVRLDRIACFEISRGLAREQVAARLGANLATRGLLVPQLKDRVRRVRLEVNC